MSRGPYIPQPGTIPFRVIEHLKTLPKGSEISTPDLCEALDLDLTGPFRAYMEGALRNGALKSTVKPRGSRNVAHWSLGDGVPMPQPEPEEEALEPLAETPKPASPWAFPPRSVFDLAAAASSKSEKQEAEPELAPPPKPANALGWVAAPPAPPAAEQVADVAPEVTMVLPDCFDLMAEALKPEAADAAAHPVDDPFVCALWSDGRLQLQRADTELALLTVDETRALLHYLERVCGAEVVA